MSKQKAPLNTAFASAGKFFKAFLKTLFSTNDNFFKRDTI